MEPKLKKVDQVFEKSYNRPKVVLMPDIFIDHFIKFDLELTGLLAKIQEVANRESGGILMGTDQKFLCGGHAGIAGSTLAVLGAEVKIVAETDSIGESFAKAVLETKGIDLSLVSNQGKISSTAAMEFRLNSRLVNVMIPYSGSVKQFGFDKLSEESKKAIEEADAVLVSNWAQNKEGTDLAAKVFKLARDNQTVTFLDTSDPSPSLESVPGLVSKVIKSKNLDIFSLNENEATLFASTYDSFVVRQREEEKAQFLVVEAVKFLHEKWNRIEICLHTQNFAMMLSNEGDYYAPSFQIMPFRSTGAGDVWNGGYILARFNDLEPEEQMIFANAVAGCYISDPQGRYPTIDQVLSFVKKRQLRPEPYF